MKVLITGANGLVGSKLLPLLKGRGHELLCYPGDIRNVLALREFVSPHELDAVIHLAAQSNIPACEKDPQSAYEINTAGTLALLDALKARSKPVHIIFPSTAQVYLPLSAEEIERKESITESRAIQPQTLYARTKWAAEVALRDAVLRGPHQVTILRLFNHTHKSQSPDFFLPHAYQSLSNRKPGSTVSLPVGNIDIYRDFGSVFDLLGAFAAVLEGRRPGEAAQLFNVCSERAKHLRVILEALAAKLEVKAEFTTDPRWVRKNEPTWLCGSYDKIRAAFGWSPDCETEEQLVEAFLRD